LHVIHWISA